MIHTISVTVPINYLPNPGPCGARYADKLRTWCTARGVKLHGRVLPNGEHHVWFWTAMWRKDAEHRDFEFTCQMLWNEIVARGFDR